MSGTLEKYDRLRRTCPPFSVEGHYSPSPLSPGTGVGPYNDPQPQLLQHKSPQPASHGEVLKQPSPPPVVALQPPHSPDDPMMIPGGLSGLAKEIFPYELLATATDEFSAANFLGEGAFGSVHKGVFFNGMEVVVKKLTAGSVLGGDEFLKEFKSICVIYHTNLVSMVGFCDTGSHRLLVYKFVPNNTLEYHLHGKSQPIIDWPTRLKIALGVARGLEYLHENCGRNIIHCDIKASNILLDFEFVAKVSDFGLARFVSDFDAHVSTGIMGINGYLDPEYALTGKLTDKSDVFSYGVVLLELITGRKPIDPPHSTLADWARPLLIQALKCEDFGALVDPRLHNDYDEWQMTLMAACALACVRCSASRRPRMSQIVIALQGYVSALFD